MFLRPPKNLQEYGGWAMITGSTDGIGKAMAFELASKGLNLVLVGRNPSKLQATEAEIRSWHKVDVKSIVVDLAKCCEEEIERVIKDGIEGLDVGIVVNNAGVANPYPRYFHEVDSELMERMLRVNVEAATWVVKSVVPAMAGKKKGVIVNVGSACTVVLPSYPLYTLYAATKAYLAMFSRSIALEYKHNGIDIQCQKAKIMLVSPKKYAESSIKWMGYEQLPSRLPEERTRQRCQETRR